MILTKQDKTIYQAYYKLEHYCTITQAEMFAIYKALE